MNKRFLTILVLIAVGVVYRLFLTSDGNFFFNIDNARDMVDIREMVVLQKPRLTGPTSAIEGLYNGPFWYYLLAIPFIASGGAPYASIILEIILWTIGGFFLLKLTSRFGLVPVILVGSLWISSNYILLLTFYAFNPNPVALLVPLFIYSLERYLNTNKLVYCSATFLIGGLFFNLEMNFGVFIPAIIIASLIISKRERFLKDKNFWIGLAFFVATFLPQVLFDLRHQFIMSKSVIEYLSTSGEMLTNPLIRIPIIAQKFYGSFLPTMMNLQVLTKLLLVLFVIGLFFYLKKGLDKLDKAVMIALTIILVPFFGYIFLPVTVNSWHLGAEMTSAIFLSGFTLKESLKVGIFGKAIAITLFIYVILASLGNISNYLKERGNLTHDPSSFKNEIAALDYVYQQAKGKNFKVYTYFPSVYDYPYQYLFWWYGQKRYGYLPQDYAYLPNKPAYIRNKEKFSNGKRLKDSGLVFLIKEPHDPRLKNLWENNFANLKLLSATKVGPLEIETRKTVE